MLYVRKYSTTFFHGEKTGRKKIVFQHLFLPSRRKKDGRKIQNKGNISKDNGRRTLRDARFCFTQKVLKLIEPKDLCVSQLMQISTP